jgi:hypothetical protein
MSKFTLLALLAAVTLSFSAGAAFAGENCGGCAKDKDKAGAKDKSKATKDGEKKTEGETKTN